MKRMAWLWAGVLLTFGLLMPGEPSVGSRLRAAYGSVPKGLVLEGIARGFDRIEVIGYDAEQHRFVINRTQYYPLPKSIDREALAAILEGLDKDDKVGVTYTPGGKVVVYGAINKASPLLQDLAKADRLLVSVVFGWEKNLRDVTLPNSWKPAENPDRKNPVICVTVLTDYAFSLSGDTYYRTNLAMSNLLVPMAKKVSEDGGYVEAGGLAKPEGTDKDNLDYLKAHAKEFLELPLLKRAADTGEVAAFARLLRETGKNGMDLKKLADHIRKAK